MFMYGSIDLLILLAFEKMTKQKTHAFSDHFSKIFNLFKSMLYFRGKSKKSVFIIFDTFNVAVRIFFIFILELVLYLLDLPNIK